MLSRRADRESISGLFPLGRRPFPHYSQRLTHSSVFVFVPFHLLTTILGHWPHGKMSNVQPQTSDSKSARPWGIRIFRYVLSRPHSSRPISHPNQGLHPQDEPYRRTSRYFILPFQQWRPHAKRRAQRSVPCIFLLRNSPSDARETVLIYEDITHPSGPDIPFPPWNFVFIIDTIICRTFIHTVLLYIKVCTDVLTYDTNYYPYSMGAQGCTWNTAMWSDHRTSLPCIFVLVRSSFPIQTLETVNISVRTHGLVLLYSGDVSGTHWLLQGPSLNISVTLQELSANM